ncbi:T9SS type A sorting domain-containing protein [bacterium]|nr:T9SS type A sorting domain-containing protein [bacterium]
MRVENACLAPPLLFLIMTCCSLHGQTIISDSTYQSANWSETVVTTFGASETHTQRTTGGNPGAFRFMQHILPAPPGPSDLTRLEVTHIYDGDAYLPLEAIDHIDYAEDIRLLDLPWNQAFIRSFPAIRQSGRIFRANVFLQVVADTLWHSGSLTGLTASSFTALDGSGDHPDFSDVGDFLYFGFSRLSSRGATQPPLPPNQDLIYRHGSDNFTVTIHNAPLPNQPPVARADDYLYLDYFFNSNKTLRVLQNDSDPEGDPIRVLSVGEPAFGGAIESFNDTSITYSHEGLLSASLETDFFLYKITDGLNQSLDAFVTMHFCRCPLECLALFLPPPALRTAAGRVIATAAIVDTLEVDLFRRFRDEALLTTQTGTQFVNLYYRAAPEVMPLLLFDRSDLGMQAVRALAMMQAPLHNLLDGDGSMLVTQTLIDSVSAFLDSLGSAASDSLRDALNVELARLGSLQQLVGLSVAEAAEMALGHQTSIDDTRLAKPQEFVLKQNYPNPFNPATEIRYHLPQTTQVELTIFDIQGRKIRTLVQGLQVAGEKTIVWDGADDHNRGVPSGIYFCRLSAGAFQETKKMILMR